jgi:hypothetical protein
MPCGSLATRVGEEGHKPGADVTRGGYPLPVIASVKRCPTCSPTKFGWPRGRECC